MPEPTRPELLKFAAAGVAYILIANVLLLFLFTCSLRMMDIPALQSADGIGIRCGVMTEDHWDTHPMWQMHWLSYGPEILLILFVVIGFVWYRAIRQKNKNNKSVGLWLSVLLMATPLYYGSVIITTVILRIIRGKPFEEIFDRAAINPIVSISLLSYSIVAGLWLYFKVFRKEERKYLWLISLPAIVITFFTWIFVLGPLVLSL